MSQVEDFDADFITETLLYHVLDPSLGAVASGDLQGYQNVPTLMVDEQYVNRNEDAQVLNVFKRHHNVSVNFGIPGDRRATANVVIADIQCSNGVVHVIDKVLTFPPDVPSIANAAHLSILNQAIVKAGLVQDLIDTPSTTVFAPTNTAFQAVQWQNLTVDTLKAVLLYHVVPAVAFSTDLGENQDLPTLLTQTVNVKASGGQVTINDAIKVVTPNVITKSGVVHVVDQVILPPAMSL